MNLESCEIHKFQKRQATDAIFFGFAEGVYACMPLVTLDKIIDLFFKRFDIDEANRESIRTEYSRMKKELIDSRRTTQEP